MNFTQLTERAKKTLNAGQPEPRIWAENEIELAACVNQAKSQVARAVMRDDKRRSLLQQEYSVTLDSSGVGDLLTATGAIPGEMMMEGIEWGAVVDGNGDIIQLLTHYHDFIRPQDTNYAYCCRKERSIHTRASGVQVLGPNDIQGLSGTLTITASFEPESVDDFPSELEPDLVAALCDVVRPNAETDAA